MTDTHPSVSSVGRRSVLAGVGAASLATGLPLAHADATPQNSDSTERTIARFAVVTDTHLNAEVTTRADVMRRIFAWIADRDPDVVLHCGDITDYGADDEFAAYVATIPASLRGRLRHVAGNHEWRWDPMVLQNYEKLFGPADSSFAVKGLRFVGLSPFQVLEEPCVFGAERLAWLEKTLSGSPGERGMPVICFQHMPVGRDEYFVNDQEDFIALLEHHNARVLFAGHTHAQRLARFNGLTQITGNATRNGWAYWAEVVRRSSALTLRVQSVQVAADGTGTLAPVTEVALNGPRADLDLAPDRVRITPQGDQVTVDVVAPGATAVEAQSYPQHIFGGRRAAAATALTAQGGGRFRVTMPVERSLAGQHRLQVRVGDGTQTYDLTRRFSQPATGARVVDAVRLGGAVQPAIMRVIDEADSDVIAATTSGVLTRLRVEGDRLERRWRREVGPMARAGAVLDRTLFVPTIDHTVTAVDVDSGRVRWTRDVGAPALSQVVATRVAGRPAVFATAGPHTYRLDPTTGRVMWRATQGQLFGGRLAVDDARVYVGSGTGHAMAFDVATGAQLWSVDISGKADRYGRMLYAPWGNAVLLPTDSSVLFSTVSASFCLDRATGAQVWKLDGNRTYNPGLVLPEGIALANENWKVELLDPATGAVRWASPGPGLERFFSAGLVRDGDSLLLVSVGARLQRFDLATGASTELLQITPANTFSTPVLVGRGPRRRLVVGHQDGVVRLVRVE